VIKLLKRINNGHINRYLMYLRDEGRSKVTISKTRYILNKLLQDSHGIISNRNLLYHKKRLQRQRVRYRGVTDFQQKSSVNTIIFTIVSFLRWLHVPVPKKFKLKFNKRGLPKYLKKEELDNLRERMEELPDIDTLPIKFMLLMGMRLSEVINLRIDDIDFHEKTISLIGKGGIPRTVIIPEILIPQVKTWLQTRKEIEIDSDNLFVFEGRFGWIPIYPVYVQRKLKKISKRLHPHRLRHTFATKSLLADVPLNVIQDILGHTTVATTSIYTKVTGKTQRIAMDKIKDWWKK